MRLSLAALLVATAAAAGCSGGTPQTFGTRIVRFDIHSRLLGRTLGQIGITPAGPHHRRGLLVFLHGSGGRPDDLLWDETLRALRGLGRRAPDVVFVNGDDHSYYHDRSDGPWGSYVLREAVPAAVRELGADSRRVAIGGISMGGFGAFNLARLEPRRFCAVGGHSPALWEAAAATPAGAFDDAADFERNDLFGAARAGSPYGNMPVWIDVGASDSLRPADTAFAHLLRADGEHVRFHVWPGEHGSDYWRAHVDAYFRFYAEALAACRR